MRLFEIEGGIVKATEHCYMISWLKNIIDEYPEEYLKVFAYIYYTSDLSPDNPYFNVLAEDKEQKILKDLQPEFDIEDPLILYAIDECTKLYTTPTMRSYDAIKTMLDNMNTYLKTTEITDGREGNIGSMLRVAKDFKSVRESFKGVQGDLAEETKIRARGGMKLPYDLKRRS